jgi:hypothetical protein
VTKRRDESVRCDESTACRDGETAELKGKRPFIGSQSFEPGLFPVGRPCPVPDLPPVIANVIRHADAVRES